ncbi:GNAT family N-acetyltransferase [Rhizobium sp. T1473]|uniref:GNAT family N-acetyltransferase n=1 Tax=unclassified Rhizobium TaxID=2613769 RepID=UPI001AAFD3D4
MPLANARRAKPSKSSRSGIPDVIRKPPFAVLIQNSTDLETSKRVRDRSRWYNGQVVGTLGLKDIGNNQTALRKMFVAADVRGREHNVAARLLAELVGHAENQGIKEIFLGTTDKFLAAHRFYEKNGFTEVPKGDLPRSFPLMAVDTKFYRRRIGTAES